MELNDNNDALPLDIHLHIDKMSIYFIAKGY